MGDVAENTALAPALEQETNSKLTENPIFRQLAVMIGIAASVALGMAVVLWSQAPSLAPLYGNLAEKDASQVLELLQQNGIEYQVEEGSGLIMVPAGKVKEVRMQLASAGLPNSSGMGFELLQQDMGFGTSRVVERARYVQAMQGELARTIVTIGNVQSARVHLAIPKQSVFVRERKKPSASVTVRLLSGRTLDPGQVDAIVHLVASSVPELETGRVTVVDQKGNLLSGDGSAKDLKLSSSQFDYTRRIEDHYRERIESLLAPILGADRVRAQVNAEIDFSVTEQTQERYNPDQPALRSEHINEQERSNGLAQGIPGALSNQPPVAGEAPEVARDGGENARDSVRDSSRQATRNYELDRTISHKRLAQNALRRLSVAVVVDDRNVTLADGNKERRERTPEEIERITQLVHEAIGFDVRRGDSVRVVNSSFLDPEPIEALPEPALWEQAWFLDLLKQVGGVAVVLLLIFGVLRPTLARLTGSPGTELAVAEGGADVAGADGATVTGPLGADGMPTGDSGEQPLKLGVDEERVKLPDGGGYENIMMAARDLVGEDPKRVAQLVKNWIEEDGG